MKNVKKFELIPVDCRKSFYGKCYVTEYANGLKVLTSYTTDVAAIYRGHFYRLWSGDSVTTMRHVNAFLNAYGIHGGGVAWWRKQPVYKINNGQYILSISGGAIDIKEV